jgi:hypothetical protein
MYCILQERPSKEDYTWDDLPSNRLPYYSSFLPGYQTLPARHRLDYYHQGAYQTLPNQIRQHVGRANPTRQHVGRCLLPNPTRPLVGRSLPPLSADYSALQYSFGYQASLVYDTKSVSFFRQIILSL